MEGWPRLDGESAELRQGFEHLLHLGTVFRRDFKNHSVLSEVFANLRVTDSPLGLQVDFIPAYHYGDLNVLLRLAKLGFGLFDLCA